MCKVQQKHCLGLILRDHEEVVYIGLRSFSCVRFHGSNDAVGLSLADGPGSVLEAKVSF